MQNILHTLRPHSQLHLSVQLGSAEAVHGETAKLSPLLAPSLKERLRLPTGEKAMLPDQYQGLQQS